MKIIVYKNHAATPQNLKTLFHPKVRPCTFGVGLGGKRIKKFIAIL